METIITDERATMKPRDIVQRRFQRMLDTIDPHLINWPDVVPNQAIEHAKEQTDDRSRCPQPR